HVAQLQPTSKRAIGAAVAKIQTIHPGPSMTILRRRPGLIALVSGAVSATGFEPLHLWPLTLIAVALLIHLLWQAESRRAAARIGYAFGLGQFAIALNWIAHAFTFQDAMPHWFGYVSVVLLACYVALYPAMAAFIGWTLGRGRPHLFALFFACA